MNTTGRIFRLTTFGESHGPAIGGVIDGMPAGVEIDLDAVQRRLDERRPGTSALVTPRNEADRVHVLSGIFEGRTTGTPIGFVIENTAQHSTDYNNLHDTLRPGHADYTYMAKYGVRDHNGGGRASARETACRVVGGAMAEQVLALNGITVTAWAAQIGTATADAPGPLTDAMKAQIQAARADGDTLGGIVAVCVDGCPPGLGEPVFGKLQAMLAAAMMSINAAHGFEYGMGFAGAARRGSEVTDNWVADPADPRGLHAAANHSGGIQGGISNGEPITMRVAFKPVATLLRDVETVSQQADGTYTDTVLRARGRHDPCVVPRAVPVVRAMAAMTILDALLMARCSRC